MGNALKRSARRHKIKEKKLKNPIFLYRVLYWSLIFLLMGGLLAGVYYMLQADFGHCNSYDSKCF
ncbi:uncharacterized protein LOC6579084 [Drosophila mojavensis]|uniref:Uncharacterized protein n=1 Tax=Drosophila mojavensis TaxID=7230 RepID=B4KNF7_DROMO|nr:uncharacterized protein LOC6579084 [Drosophila mojavensis]EDW08916.1 uncharacterized protein Dmoj_GI19310 [Drosophila mojavensis]